MSLNRPACYWRFRRDVSIQPYAWRSRSSRLNMSVHCTGNISGQCSWSCSEPALFRSIAGSSYSTKCSGSQVRFLRNGAADGRGGNKVPHGLVQHLNKVPVI